MFFLVIERMLYTKWLYCNNWELNWNSHIIWQSTLLNEPPSICLTSYLVKFLHWKLVFKQILTCTSTWALSTESITINEIVYSIQHPYCWNKLSEQISKWALLILQVSTLMYFAISLLLLDGWSDWLQMSNGATDHVGECQNL